MPSVVISRCVSETAAPAISKTQRSIFQLKKKKTVLKQFIQEAHKGDPIPGNVHQRQYRHGRPKPRGIHDYQNLQWDPNVYRGKTWRDFREKNLPPYTTTVNFGQFCCTECHKLDKDGPQHKLRRRRSVAHPREKIGGIFLPTDSEALADEYATKPERRNKFDETFTQLLPFIVEQEVVTEYRESGTQYDETCDPGPPTYHRNQLGASKGVQAIIADDENEMAQIVQDISGKVVSQGLTETVEEARLRQIREETTQYMEQRAIREYNQRKLAERELFRAMVAAKERTLLYSQYEDMQDAEEFIGAITFSINISSRLFTETIANLRQENFFALGSKAIEDKFNRWIHTEKTFLRNISPYNLLDDIIQNAINMRELATEEVPPVPAVPFNSRRNDGSLLPGNTPEEVGETWDFDEDLLGVYYNPHSED